MSEKKVITFLYHEVTNIPESTGFQRLGALPYKHTFEQFNSDLCAIKKFHKAAVSFDAIWKTDGDSLVMTFDDGGLSAEYIAEQLSQIGWIGHFFVTTSLIGKPGFLDASQIKMIAQAGHIIGSHSHTHPNVFRSISYEQKIHEWQTSKNILEELLGEPVTCASIPGGDLDDETIKAAGEVGLSFLFTSEPTYRSWKKYGVTCFGRVCPKNSTKTQIVANWASGRGFKKAQLVRKTKEVVRVWLKPLYKIYVRYKEKGLSSG